MTDQIRPSPSAWQALQIGAARAHQVLGWPGLLGIALLGYAVIWGAWAASRHQAFLDAHSPAQPPARVHKPVEPIVATALVHAPMPEFPSVAEMPLLLTQVKYAAISQGLDWRAAEYRVIPATVTQPASLEIRCSIKGAYPKLRGMLVHLLEMLPHLSIREFKASRPNADVSDVEAKLLIGIVLKDAPDAAQMASGMGK